MQLLRLTDMPLALMRPSTFICTFFFVAAIWAAPVPVGEQYKLDVYPHGAIVGARAKHLSGEKDKKAAVSSFQSMKMIYLTIG